MAHSSDTKVIHNIPEHVAVIMDGNGRWARKRGLPRSVGHKKGSEAARDIVKNAAKAGVKYLTLFGFSSENWNRPQDEIKELMKLLRHYLRSQTADLHKNNVRLSVIGGRSAFDDDIVALIENAENLTKDNDKIHVIIALNYGGRGDIAQAAQRLIAQALKTGNVPDAKDIEADLSNALLTAGIPDPDLLIRTSGEQRISNFLLWQCAYTEMVFTQTLWPDFNEKDLNDALNEYAGRDRRFGALKQSEG
ncbi:MAG: di-trans,poly-cis-decaprenylcistransferase [Alphaproteobacteria bacterium]|nr:MAG: di-trans,poly-cis-decaprenylcistransferase [Alphaproteobacteria bacterium]